MALPRRYSAYLRHTFCKFLASKVLSHIDMQLQRTPASVSVLNPEYAVFGIIILAHQHLPTHWIYKYQNLGMSLHLNYISLRVTANAIMHVLFKR